MGGGKSKAPPPLPEPEPMPERGKDPVSKRIRDAGSKKLRRKTGFRGNIITSPLGVTGQAVNGLGALFGNVKGLS